MNVNARGVFLCMKYEILQFRKQQQQETNPMKQHDYSIVNTASIAGINGGAGQCGYAASKAAVINMTKVAAVEYAKTNIRV